MFIAREKAVDNKNSEQHWKTL